MTDTGNELSEILSRDLNTTETTTETTTTDTNQPRDEQGRFANGQAGQPLQQAAPEGQQTQAEEQTGAMVPQQALHAERQKNKTLEARLEEMGNQIANLSRQVQTPRQQPAPQQQQEQPKPKDFWEAPEEFVRQQLSPLEQAMQRQREGVSRMLAVSSHGEEKVNAAYTALAEALQTNPATTFEYRRIMAADHPFDELVKWNDRRLTLDRIGNDPDAFVKSELARMLADPARAAEILQQIQQGASANPVNRSQAPATQLPPSISQLPGGGANNAGGMDMSEEGRFARATAGLGKK